MSNRTLKELKNLSPWVRTTSSQPRTHGMPGRSQRAVLLEASCDNLRMRMLLICLF